MSRQRSLLVAVVLLAQLTGTLAAAEGAGTGTAASADTTREAAAALVRQGKYDDAEALLMQAARVSPHPELLYHTLGQLHQQRGNNAKAIAAFKEGIAIHEQGRRGRP